MNGPVHFREAERLLGQLDRGEHDNHDGPVVAARAQVHATLALAAATAADQATAYDGDEQHDRSRGWAGVA